MTERVSIIGAGLAGCEAAYQLAKRGIDVTFLEMKPQSRSPAHVSDGFAELVCSNSLRGDDLSNAVGLLKEEMRRLDSLILSCAEATRVPAGGALAVDREAFSSLVTARIRANARVTVVSREVAELPDGEVIVATGPLTSDKLAATLATLLPSSKLLSFFDAAAPIVTAESVDMASAYLASRYDKGSADYINCPLTRDEYTAFREALASAEQAEARGFEDGAVFEGCMPIEVMARRGEDVMRFGPMKPVGLRDPRTGREPYAVVQLRRDNAAGSLYNLVGFQTHLKFGEQRRVFGMIPALCGAEFARYGVMHRNTYLNSPQLLDRYYRLRSEPRVAFAGQITGVEGYVESAASGLLAGVELSRALRGLPPADFPGETAIGALALYVSAEAVTAFQPMNVNFGIVAPLGTRVRAKRDRNLAIAARSLDIIDKKVQEGL
ncbi:MAG: methylenetetrahydrofolate--tRNA-(uracil(54)-C(5))-methyltransferase (FADH(2)-oxidizing) TrmFO [Oscillospiraceae bacterium]|jgi:methylenetetrahydrofolate--tRNA-(uracil-5-)-methyltransferase|nr:methylenetetrahydrofolate--tRNA-(uracil(54)-C(5))-methyltransferase (FADH(2)-oxidizing) TrmFO [Oscillospiraceae bacterium]